MQLSLGHKILIAPGVYSHESGCDTAISKRGYREFVVGRTMLGTPPRAQLKGTPIDFRPPSHLGVCLRLVPNEDFGSN
jgi:hypothetical protein